MPAVMASRPSLAASSAASLMRLDRSAPEKPAGARERAGPGEGAASFGLRACCAAR
jgi:hypothetical protein